MELFAVTDTVHTAPLGAGMYLSPGDLEADMSDSDEDRIDDDDGESDLRFTSYSLLHCWIVLLCCNCLVCLDEFISYNCCYRCGRETRV